MAPRLAVIVSQSPVRDARSADIEESIVAELIMVGGLDATLVGPLQQIQPDSTDLLCLSGFTQDIALLSWMDATEAAQAWDDLKLTGTFLPMSLDGTAVTDNRNTHGRRIFYIRLTAQSVPTAVCKQLKSRLQLMRVQPVSLQLKLKAPTKSLPMAAASEVESPQQPSDHVVEIPRTDVANSESTSTAKFVSASESSANATRTGDARSDETMADAEWKNLDQLVDELDLLDL